MKKVCISILACLLAVLCLTSCATTKGTSQPVIGKNFNNDIDYPALMFDSADYGAKLGFEHDGYVWFAATTGTPIPEQCKLPEQFSNGVVIIAITEDYYYKGKKYTSEVDMVYFNVEPASYLLDCCPERPVTVKTGDDLGTCLDNPGVILRCTRPNEHLVCCARVMPKYDGDYWYFGAESLVASVPKFLLFKPVSSRKDVVFFHTDNNTQSLESITYSSNSMDQLSHFPAEGIRVLTQLSEYPETTVPRNTTELSGRNMYFKDKNLDITIDFDGLILHFMYPDYFIDYLIDEYELGTDIYLYGNIVYSLNGELFLYGRDYQTYDPDLEVDDKMATILKANLGDNSLR